MVQPEIWACCLQKLAGMTGTAATEAAEFSNIYKLEVTEVPTNKPLSRTDNPDVVFRSEAGGPSRPALRQLATLLTPAVCKSAIVRTPSLPRDSVRVIGLSAYGMRCLL